MRDVLENGEVEKSGDPKDHIKDHGPEELRQYYLPVANRCSHQRFDGAELEFLRESPHRNQRENQDKGEPEEDRVKKCFLHRVLHGALIHERNLEVKIRSAHEEEEEQDDVCDRRVEVTRYFAG